MRAFVVLALIVAGPAFAGAYVIVKKDGKRIEAKAPPEYRGGSASFTLAAGGTRVSLPEAHVDKAATTRANAAAPAKGGAAVGTPRGPGAVAPGGGKATFTNEDLAGRGAGTEGTSPMQPGVTPAPAGPPPSHSGDWAARHDEEMVRAEAERRSADLQRVKEAEQRLLDLREDFQRLHADVLSDAEVSASEIEDERRLEEEIREAERDLSEARRSR